MNAHIRLSVDVEIDPKVWAENYGVAASDVDQDAARSLGEALATLLTEHIEATGNVGKVTLR